MIKRNWRAKYLSLTEWDDFKRNDWKYLNWKLDITIGLLVVILGAALTKLFA